MHKEVLPPRSYRLERVAIVAALVSLVVACADIAGIPEPGHYYSCESRLDCDNTTSKLTGKICATDEAGAVLRFETDAPAWLDEHNVVCETREVSNIACAQTSELCAAEPVLR